MRSSMDVRGGYVLVRLGLGKGHMRKAWSALFHMMLRLGGSGYTCLRAAASSSAELLTGRVIISIICMYLEGLSNEKKNSNMCCRGYRVMLQSTCAPKDAITVKTGNSSRLAFP